MPDVHTHYKVELEIVLQNVTNIHEKWHSKVIFISSSRFGLSSMMITYFPPKGENGDCCMKRN